MDLADSWNGVVLVLARRRKGNALGEGVLQEPVDHGLDGGGDGDQEVLTPHICPDQNNAIFRHLSQLVLGPTTASANTSAFRDAFASSSHREC